MFNKVLVANRGEIAVRVIRACRELGISTVAVYSDLDSDSLHVRLADEAYALGGETAKESYLNTDRLLQAISASGANAVHPGYGFYSENADFARTLAEHDVCFIGPPPEAIEIMGDKISSRKAADRAGVKGVPGNSEFLSSVTEVVDFGNQHGWPIAIKAAFGGGGRGMKVVRAESEADSALASAQREAEAYFGRHECYIEKYLDNPRHIEIQVVADNSGGIVHLGPRDCSSQRRHQKLIEEAPVPDIHHDVVAAMGEAAIELAKSCNYVGAGTVEFLYDGSEFYYLEMNTRLQVEHCVTEMVSGIDLVAAQVRIAAGEPLGFSQEDVELRGHAIEVRINAEDPTDGRFTPSPGVIVELETPSGPGVRWDGGYSEGDEISQHYDNLIGKLVCWGADRQTAISRTLRSLEEFRISGVKTTIEADKAILRHRDFVAAEHSTNWVENVLDLTNLPTPDEVPWQASRDASRGRPNMGPVQQIEMEINGKRFDVRLKVDEPSPSRPKPERPGRHNQTSTQSGSGEVRVPMQGTVVQVTAAVGDTVQPGEPLLVLEAMKMENQISSTVGGIVESILVSVGDTVGGGTVVATVSPEQQ